MFIDILQTALRHRRGQVNKKFCRADLPRAAELSLQ
jgi:hypothetical protein